MCGSSGYSRSSHNNFGHTRCGSRMEWRPTGRDFIENSSSSSNENDSHAITLGRSFANRLEQGVFTVSGDRHLENRGVVVVPHHEPTRMGGGEREEMQKGKKTRRVDDRGVPLLARTIDGTWDKPVSGSHNTESARHEIERSRSRNLLGRQRTDSWQEELEARTKELEKQRNFKSWTKLG